MGDLGCLPGVAAVAALSLEWLLLLLPPPVSVASVASEVAARCHRLAEPREAGEAPVLPLGLVQGAEMTSRSRALLQPGLCDPTPVRPR